LPASHEELWVEMVLVGEVELEETLGDLPGGDEVLYH